MPAIATPYEDLLAEVAAVGVAKGDRTGTGTSSVFGRQIRFDLSKGFPLIWTKRVHWPSIAYELLWFLRGETNVKWLQDRGVTIWNEWSKYGVGNGVNDVDRKVIEVPVRVVPSDEIAESMEDADPRHGILDREGGALFSCWKKMLNRCYNESAHNFGMYGGAGVRVCTRWMTFENYLADVKGLLNWDKKAKDWSGFELDKDYYGSKVYSPDTTIWLGTDENNLYTKSSRPFSVTDEAGKKEIFLSLSQAERKLRVPRATLSRLLNDDNKNGQSGLKGNNRSKSGWVFRYEQPSEGYNFRLSMLDGDLGPVYGSQWRSWPTPDGGQIDQIAKVIESIRKNPSGRRHIVTAWNPAEVDSMALPPCHAFFQFYVAPGVDGAPGKLSCQLYQRSADMFLGVPFNIASYALLTHMVAQQTGLDVGEFIWTGGDVHIYDNHTDQVAKQLGRLDDIRSYPELKFHRVPDSIFDYTFEDFEIIGYDPHPLIKAPVAV